MYKLILGDCLEKMKDIPDCSVDMVLCDLPYGTTACKWDVVLPLNKLWEQWKRVLSHQGSVLLFGTEPFSTRLRMSNMDWYKYDWIWHKPSTTGFQHAKNMPLRDYEIISVFSGAAMGHESLLGNKRMIYNPQGLIEINKVAKRHPEYEFGTIVGHRKSHKTEVLRKYTNYPRMVLEFPKDPENYHTSQKPVALLRYLIRTYTNPGGVVLDNTMGSGSTCVAAAIEDRNCIGIEKEEKYYDIAVERMKEICNA